jgi:AraC family transcriptional regulator, transcriptional activator of pobA
MKNKLPVYDLEAFQGKQATLEFYANELNTHVKEHAFTHLPHKHDFYLVILITKGKGYHEVDFERYSANPGFLFVLKPGQMHYWKFSGDINGFVFFHSKAFYEEGYTSARLNDFPFYETSQGTPLIKLKGRELSEINTLMREINAEYKSNLQYKNQKLHALINLVYISLSRNYKGTKRTGTPAYLAKVLEFENLLEKHFITLKSAGDYAAMLNITEKHLNRITRSTYNKTSTRLIAERIILEAKRMLIHSGLNVTQVAYALGYQDKSYFVRFFKKNAGETPLTFLQKYKERNS